jgi:hypothetical protein
MSAVVLLARIMEACMSFWNKLGDILELLGQRLETPEYIICCGGEWEDEPDRNRPSAHPRRPLTIAPREGAAKLSAPRPLGNT